MIEFNGEYYLNKYLCVMRNGDHKGCMMKAMSSKLKFQFFYGLEGFFLIFVQPQMQR